MKYEFQVGDRVEMAGTLRKSYGLGTVCEVRCYLGGIVDYGVCWDRNIGGHSCDGSCEPGHGWYVLPNQINFLEEETLEINLSGIEQLL